MAAKKFLLKSHIIYLKNVSSETHRATHMKRVMKREGWRGGERSWKEGGGGWEVVEGDEEIKRDTEMLITQYYSHTDIFLF